MFGYFVVFVFLISIYCKSKQFKLILQWFYIKMRYCCTKNNEKWLNKWKLLRKSKNIEFKEEKKLLFVDVHWTRRPSFWWLWNGHLRFLRWRFISMNCVFIWVRTQNIHWSVRFRVSKSHLSQWPLAHRFRYVLLKFAVRCMLGVKCEIFYLTFNIGPNIIANVIIRWTYWIGRLNQ